jgi:hypothetical protein
MISLKKILNKEPQSINEVTLQKGKTYGGTKCEGGCFMGKEGLKKIIKISKDSPKDVFMFRDDNYSGLQPHFVKDGVIAKATVLNPAYDLEKHKVRNLNIGKDVILSVRLFVSTNESVNEGKYYVTYNLGRGRGKDLEKEFDQKTFKTTNKPKVFSSYSDAKKYAEKMEKMFRNSIGGGTAYWVSDEKMNPIKESVNEAAGTLTIEKRKDGKYYWQYKFKSGKKEDWPEGFNTKADAQKDFMYRSKYIKEAKAPYEVYHKSYTSAIEAAREYAEKKGFEIDNDDSFTKIGMGPRKPSEGKTNKFSIQLSKDGKLQRKQLHIQVYGMKNSYELNAYIG